MEIQNDQSFITYALPPLLNQSGKINETMYSANPIISEMYNASKSSNKTVINYFSNDIATGQKRVISQALPLYKNNKFTGAIIEELDLN